MRNFIVSEVTDRYHAPEWCVDICFIASSMWFGHTDYVPLGHPLYRMTAGADFVCLQYRNCRFVNGVCCLVPELWLWLLRRYIVATISVPVFPGEFECLDGTIVRFGVSFTVAECASFRRVIRDMVWRPRFAWAIDISTLLRYAHYWYVYGGILSVYLLLGKLQLFAIADSTEYPLNRMSVSSNIIPSSLSSFASADSHRRNVTSKINFRMLVNGLVK
ncbi:uncharacterized protein LOC131693062 [Topomyia yanbarensis]|uniref:uncharacterized protein LOC131693062 n=1 Tax=Topomyia yanbarensis TaxID=2498891 RepID=UPI00273C8FB3|nr:uncharacterized protein LOC131693062 [Topomyia yanbarensis]